MALDMPATASCNCNLKYIAYLDENYTPSEATSEGEAYWLSKPNIEK